MKQQWERLEAWLKANNPALLADLNPPASDADIQELEQKLGVTLPADFVACLKVHDGQKGGADWLFNGYEFLSVERILDCWSFWKRLRESSGFDNDGAEPDPGVKGDWWNVGWIPFAYNGSGDYLCIDLVPALGGVSGQIIEVWHDDGVRRLRGKSFLEFMQGL